MNIDDTDRRLLVLLESDGRCTVTALAERVSLSGPAVRRRLDRLEQHGVIQRYTIDVAPHALGWEIEAFVDVVFGPSTTTDAIARWLAGHPEIVGAWTVTGQADAHLLVRASDQRHLEAFLNRLRQDAGVLNTHTVITLSRLSRPETDA